MKRVKIGVVGVDSGQLMVCDPCYLKEYKNNEYSDDKKTKEGEWSYNTVSQLTCSDSGYGQINYKMGHAGRAVAFRSGYGDGCYPVYAYLNNEGRVMKVEIDMGVDDYDD